MSRPISFKNHILHHTNCYNFRLVPLDCTPSAIVASEETSVAVRPTSVTRTSELWRPIIELVLIRMEKPVKSETHMLR